MVAELRKCGEQCEMRVREGSGEIMVGDLHLNYLQQRGTGGHSTGGADLTTLRSAGYSVMHERDKAFQQ